MKIRQEVSRILGFTIPEGKWDKSFDTLDKEGRVTKKHLLQILLLLLKKEEDRENA